MSATETAAVFKVRRLIEDGEFKKDVSFSLPNLSNAMIEQASLFAHYGTLAAKASKQVDDLKLFLEITESKVYRLIRDKAVKDGTKLTEVQLEKQVSIYEKVLEFKRALNEAKQVEAISKVAVEAFRHRKDMIVQQGALNREEMRGELSMSARNSNDSNREAILERLKNLPQSTA